MRAYEDWGGNDQSSDLPKPVASLDPFAGNCVPVPTQIMWVSLMSFLKFVARFFDALFPPILSMAVAYFLAALTSATTYTVFCQTLRPTKCVPGTFSSELLLGFIVFSVLFALPGVCAALVAWEKGYRNVFYYAATWAIAGFVISAIPPMFPDIPHDTFSRLKWLVWSVSGAMGGIVYWIGAGRFARVIKAKRREKISLADDHYSKR